MSQGAYMRTDHIARTVSVPLFLLLLMSSGRASPGIDDESNAASTSIAPLRQGSGLEFSEFGRDLLKYVVRCALPTGKNVAIPRNSGKDVLAGAFGVAPEWANAPLSESGERWVSACLLAFVNALGEHVLVSVRGNHVNLKATVTPEERRQFSYQEAAFYGDIFSEGGSQFVCRGSGGKIVSPSRAKRLCSDPSAQPGVSQCGMTITGNCSDVCSTKDAVDGFVSHCRGGGRVYDEVVTVFLPVPNK
jgi:hypothetical protein